MPVTTTVKTLDFHSYFVTYSYLYVFSVKHPPKFVLELLNAWLGESDSQETSQDPNPSVEDNQLGRLLPSMSAVLNSANVLFTSPHQYSPQQTLMPLVSLARWSILSPILLSESKTTIKQFEDYSRLHSGILECLNDVLERRYPNIIRLHQRCTLKIFGMTN